MTERDLWTTLYHLKDIHRTGWLDRGIPAAEAESVADHCFFVMLIAWTAAQSDTSLDANKVLQLAMIHDTAEAIAGDLPPYDPEDIPTDPDAMRTFFSVRLQRSPENAARKRALEETAAAHLLTLVRDTATTHWQNLWHEYEAQISAEARFVKEVDRLEVFIQSRIYAGRFPNAPVDGFSDMARQTITHPLLVPIRDAFLEEMG
ncbi:MAG: HD domain-containing protein [Thermomicrobiales bacterium]|nr:HD domain-containing protein [Thermomicrobiales bacterium]